MGQVQGRALQPCGQLLHCVELLAEFQGRGHVWTGNSDSVRGSENPVRDGFDGGKGPGLELRDMGGLLIFWGS